MSHFKVEPREFTEKVIATLLQQELKLSNTECFNLWQLGLLNQTENWWSHKLADLPPAEQKKSKDFRKGIPAQPPAPSKLESELRPSISPPPSKPPAPQIVPGLDLAYSITLPPDWTFKHRSDHFDMLASFKSLYVGVISEEAQLGTPETIANIARRNIKEHATDLKWSETSPLVLDGRKWLRFVVSAHIDSIPVAYQFYVYSGPEGTFQIVGYTSQNLFERDASLMREVMQIFRFPK